MKLWTIQYPEAYKDLCEKGVLRVPDDMVDSYWKRSYDWLVSEMIKKIGNPPDGVHYPLWAWHTLDGKRKKPDLRMGGYAKRGEKQILIEFEIPDDKVVLTDFAAWHYVLNDLWFDDPVDDNDWEENQKWFDKLPQAEQQQLKIQSWQKVFDISSNNKFLQRGYDIQATFWELKKEWIVSVREFIAK